jgi:hypothetical protein
MRSDPVVDDPLDIQDALQRRSSFGIQVLTATIRATASSQGRILSLIMICMHLRLWANGRKRMLCFEPDHAPLALRPFDFYRHFQAFSPDFSALVGPRAIAER